MAGNLKTVSRVDLSYQTVFGLWNKGSLKVLNGTNLIQKDGGNHLDSLNWNHLGPSEVTYSTNQYLTGLIFFATWYVKPALAH